MSIKYPYLPTGTQFTSEELNERFSGIADTNQGLNALKIDDFSLGCFRHNLVPTMIQSSAVTTNPIPASSFTDENNNLFGATASYGATWTEVAKVTLPTPTVLGMDFDHNVAALIILANVCVEDFTVAWTRGAAPTRPNEDSAFAEARIVVNHSGGVIILGETHRLLSPRVTIDNVGTEFASLPHDENTSQDIAIRTLVTPADLGASSGVALTEAVLQVKASPQHDLMSAQPTFTVSKSNLTAIPIHARLA